MNQRELERLEKDSVYTMRVNSDLRGSGHKETKILRDHSN
jgi:hypothetical protein